MRPNHSSLDIVSSPPVIGNALARLSRVQCELMAEALRRAVSDTGAAMSHQLSEPVTALLLYLHELKRISERSDHTETHHSSMHETIELALREIERVRGIIEQVNLSIDTTADFEIAVARGRQAIDSWTRNSHARAAGSSSQIVSYADQHPLTPRETEVLALVTSGFSNKEGGYRLGISTRTFEAHRAHLMGKLGARNAADLVRAALSRNLEATVAFDSASTEDSA